jgi:hypothetical protein
MLLPNSNFVKKGRGFLTAILLPNSNVVKREEKN